MGKYIVGQEYKFQSSSNNKPSTQVENEWPVQSSSRVGNVEKDQIFGLL